MLVSSRPSRHGDTGIDFDAATTRADALLRLRRGFAEAALDTPDLDARVLLMEALRADAVEIAVRPHLCLGPEAAARLTAFARRRLAREPVGRILGRREFWGLTFELSAATLEPRPDTETVVETALSLLPDRHAPWRLLDLGTGSGCILVALLHELPAAFGLGVDRSPEALRTARRNAVRCGVGDRAAFAASDWASALAGRFDLVVSNPPYIAAPGLAELAAEVRAHDPEGALDGGRDGLASYRVIFQQAARLLAPGAALVVEIGCDQEEAIGALAPGTGLEVCRVCRDLGGHPRAVVLRPRRRRALAGGNAALI
jgi:release factor glutamine methyltransferase